MTSFKDLEALDSSAKSVALKQLQGKVQVSKQVQSSIIADALKLTIKDKLVDPKRTSFLMQPKPLIYYHNATGIGRSDQALIHPHALGQIADVANIPRTYVRKLLEGCVGMDPDKRLGLLERCLDTHMREGVFLDRRKNPTKFLHRMVEGELRGFLSRNYNRKLGSMTMLRPFIEECTRFGAQPIDVWRNSVKMGIKYALPHIFEPVPGEFVAFGLSYTNSDFGAGQLEVAGTVLRVSSGTVAVLGDKMSRVHLGAVIQESEISLSEATLAKEAAAHISALRDMVQNQLSPENIAKTLKLITYAREKQMSWSALKDKLRDVLHKGELESVEEMLKAADSGVVDLPPVDVTDSGDPVASAWWGAMVLGHVAEEVEDEDRKESIRRTAGKLLER